jgi:hypothetical protein
MDEDPDPVTFIQSSLYELVGKAVYPFIEGLEVKRNFF